MLSGGGDELEEEEELTASWKSDDSDRPAARSSSPSPDVLRCSADPAPLVVNLSQSDRAIDPGADQWERVDVEASGRPPVCLTTRPPSS